MTLIYRGYKAFSMGDANRFMAAWVKEAGENARPLAAGDMLTEAEIKAHVPLQASQFKSSRVIPLGAFLVERSENDYSITQDGVEFIQMFDFAGRGIDLNDLSALPRNATSIHWKLTDTQKRLLLKIMLEEDPSSSGGLRSMIIMGMRYLNTMNGRWGFRHSKYCSTHDTSPSTNRGRKQQLDDAMGCDNCLPGMTWESLRNGMEIFFPNKYCSDTETDWNARTWRGTIVDLVEKYLVELGLVVEDDDKLGARFTEKGSRIYQILELREYCSENGIDMPQNILNPFLGAVPYDDEVESVLNL